MPNLANAFKYALSQSVTLFGAFHPLYLMQNNPEEHSLSLIDEAGDDDQDVTIVIGRYRSNWFQVRTVHKFAAQPKMLKMSLTLHASKK